MWTYRQSTGELSRDGKVAGVGYSGHGYHANQPTDQELHRLGPIPRGFYAIRNWRDDAHKGPCVCDLVPDPGNQMHGRDGFMLHGDNSAGNHTASEGCIIQNHATRAYVRVKATEGDDRLEVIE